MVNFYVIVSKEIVYFHSQTGWFPLDKLKHYLIRKMNLYRKHIRDNVNIPNNTNKEYYKVVENSIFKLSSKQWIKNEF